MCCVAQQAVGSLISGVFEWSRQLCGDGSGSARSCELAETEEGQLGTDSFGYVWEDTGETSSPLVPDSFSFALLSLPVWREQTEMLTAALQGGGGLSSESGPSHPSKFGP